MKITSEIVWVDPEGNETPFIPTELATKAKTKGDAGEMATTANGESGIPDDTESNAPRPFPTVGAMSANYTATVTFFDAEGNLFDEDGNEVPHEGSPEAQARKRADLQARFANRSPATNARSVSRASKDHLPAKKPPFRFPR